MKVDIESRPAPVLISRAGRGGSEPGAGRRAWRRKRAKYAGHGAEEPEEISDTSEGRKRPQNTANELLKVAM